MTNNINNTTINNLCKSSIENNICTITLCNPKKRNPLSSVLISQLQSKLDNIKKNNSIKVVIINSTGPVFSAGHDLKEVTSHENKEDRLKVLFNSCSKMMLSIMKLKQPVIASVNGLAAAAGCQLVASCDLVYVSENAKFQTPGVNIGLFCSTPMVALSRTISKKHVMNMLLTGDIIDAKEALRYGLVNNIYKESELDKEVNKIANKITSKSTQSISIGKEAFYRQLEMSITDAYDYTSEVMTINMKKSDAKEGINAFIEKRKPNWTKE